MKIFTQKNQGNPTSHFGEKILQFDWLSGHA